MKLKLLGVDGTTASGPADDTALESHLALKSVWGMSRRGNRKRPATLTTAVLGANVWSLGVALSGSQHQSEVPRMGGTQAPYKLTMLGGEATGTRATL